MTSVLCRSCSAPLEHVMTDLGMSPLSNAYIRAENLTQMERFYPLTVFVCHECFLVQLPAVETPEEIFSDYAYFSSFSDSWLQHAALYCNAMTERFGLNEKSQVIEVASNDGYLLQYFVRRGIPVLGVEPAANVARAAVERGVPSVVKFFGSRTAEELKIEGITADLLLGNNVLAHVPELNDFVEGLRLVLKPSGVITMEFPHLLRLMTGNQFDTIYHEHFSYLSLFAVERVFATHGLNIFDIEELPTHGGSLRIYAQHDRGPFEPSHRVALMRAQEAEFGVASLETYSRFAAQVQETKRKLLAFLIETRGLGKRIVGYGAPAKGNTLLNYCGVRSDFLDYTVDRSPHKQGLFLPGTHIPICEPNRIRQTRPDYVLILPWNLKNEIIEQMSYIREWGGKFVLPIPSVEVVP